MDEFLETFKPPKLYEEETNNLNRTHSKEGALNSNKIYWAEKSLGLAGLLAIFCQTSKSSMTNTS